MQAGSLPLFTFARSLDLNQTQQNVGPIIWIQTIYVVVIFFEKVNLCNNSYPVNIFRPQNVVYLLCLLYIFKWKRKSTFI